MARRIFGLVLICLGTLCVALSLLLPLVVYPGVTRLPLNPETVQTARGTGMTVLLPRSDGEGGVRVLRGVDVTTTTALSASRSADAASPGSGDTSWTASAKATVDGHGLLQASIEGFSLDRRTALADNCCADFLITGPGDTIGADVPHKGYVFAFPSALQKRSYPMWDVNIRGTADARYAATEQRRGLRTYRFEQDVPDQQLGTQELPGALFGSPGPAVEVAAMYATHRTYWAEPASGAVIDYREQVDRRFVHDGRTAPAFQGTLVAQHPAKDAFFDQIRTASTVLPLLHGRASMVAAPLGLLAEAGRRGLIGGQEDLLTDIALDLVAAGRAS